MKMWSGRLARYERLIWIGLLLLTVTARWAASDGAARAPSPVSTIAWRSSLDAALAEARRTGRPVLADFSASWCPPCIAMKHEVWPDPAVEHATERYVPLMIDVDRNTAASDRYHVEGIPTILVLDADGRVLRRAGFLSAVDMLDFLNAN